MAIAYQPATELVEVRKVDGWHVLPPIAAKVLRPSPCDDEVSAWFSTEWTNHVFYVVAKAATSPPTLRQRFLDLAQQWTDETGHLSSPTQKMLHPSYQAILGMGNENPREIIRLMILDMQQHRRPWFWALSYLAQDNPVSQSDAGKTDNIVKAWVDWGKAQRLL